MGLHEDEHMHGECGEHDRKLAALRSATERLSARRFAKDIGLADEFETDAIGCDGAETAYPFRMSGVLSWRDGDWHWRMLHASEPVG